MYTHTHQPLKNVDPVITQGRKTFLSLKKAKLQDRDTTCFSLIPDICMQAVFSSEENKSVSK